MLFAIGFLNEDESRMFQLGVGVLSINHVAYDGFEDFLQDCRDVLEIALNANFIPNVSRIGLRFINKAPLDRKWDEITQISINAPDIIKSNLQGQHLRAITSFKKLGV